MCGKPILTLHPVDNGHRAPYSTDALEFTEVHRLNMPGVALLRFRRFVAGICRNPQIAFADMRCPACVAPVDVDVHREKLGDGYPVSQVLA